MILKTQCEILTVRSVDENVTVPKDRQQALDLRFFCIVAVAGLRADDDVISLPSHNKLPSAFDLDDALEALLEICSNTIGLELMSMVLSRFPRYRGIDVMKCSLADRLFDRARTSSDDPK